MKRIFLLCFILIFFTYGCKQENITKFSNIIPSQENIDKNGTLGEAINLIEENYIRHLVVTDKGKVVGMFSVKDLEHYFCQLHDQEGIVKYKF